MTTEHSNAHILVAGAGMAGLTAALALAKRGFAVTLCERAEAFSEVGAGLQLSPNATRLLAGLGVLESVKRHAALVTSIDLASARSGCVLLGLPVNTVNASEAPHLAVHRADLQAALVESALAEPGITIRTGMALTSVMQDGSAVSATFNDGAHLATLRADALIGADGVWSQAREAVPGHSDPRHSGYMAWRATVAADGRLPPALADICRAQRVTAFLSAGAHLVAYPLRHGSSLNLVLITPGTDTSRGFDSPIDLSMLAQTIDQFEPSIGSFLADGPEWRSWPLNGCAPEGAWTHGRVALIGDAAHAMTPFAAQGACMAIEDAVVLARHLAAKPDDVPMAFSAYEAERKPRVTKVIARGAFNRFAYHVSGPAAWMRNMVFALRGPSLIRQLDWIYDYDASA